MKPSMSPAASVQPPKNVGGLPLALPGELVGLEGHTTSVFRLILPDSAPPEGSCFPPRSHKDGLPAQDEFFHP